MTSICENYVLFVGLEIAHHQLYVSAFTPISILFSFIIKGLISALTAVFQTILISKWNLVNFLFKFFLSNF